MATFILKRLLALLPVAIGVVVIVSLMTHLVPGDPADAALGPYATKEDKVAYRQSLGLDKPIAQQLTSYFLNLAKGDLGNSFIYRRSVTSLISERIRPTAELAIASLVVSLLLSIPLGILSAIKNGGLWDFFAMGFSVMGVALPNFWLGPILVLYFSLYLGWFPVSERTGFLSYILPSITMGTALAAAASRMTRNAMLDVLREDYIRTARAKGLSEMYVTWVHALRNASLPLVTIVGLQFGVLLTGAVITERVFDWPGLGSLLIGALDTRDYPVLQGCVLFFSFSYLLVNLLTDIVYAFVDPRIKICSNE